MPEGAELTPDESDEETEAKKLNIDLSDLLISQKVEKVQNSKKKKMKKKKKSERAPPSDQSTDDEKICQKSVANLINNNSLISENIDLRIESILAESKDFFIFKLSNRHKSRKISNINFKSQTLDLEKLENKTFEISLSDTEFLKNGVVTYQVESKSKSSREKKLKFSKNLTIFEKCGKWKVDDDQLVDLLHEKFFTNSKETKISSKISTLDGVISRFNGAFLVQKAANGASICGQIGQTGAKFVALLKLVENGISLVLKTESEDSETLFFTEIENLLKN